MATLAWPVDHRRVESCVFSGKEIWRSNDDPAGYCTLLHATARHCTPLHATARHCSPLLVEREGTEQFICWTP
jgi:hypothetical protein